MGNAGSQPEDEKADYKASSFPGSAIVDTLTAPCGSLKDTMDDSIHQEKGSGISKLLNQAENLCSATPTSEANGNFTEFDDEYESFRKEKNLDIDPEDNSIRQENYRPPASPGNPTAALFARALVSEVTDNPNTMKPADMAEREKRFLKAQEKARLATKNGEETKPVGAPGGVGQPSVLGTIAHALTGTTDPLAAAQAQAEEIKASVLPPNKMSESRAQQNDSNEPPLGKYTITIGLSLSQRSADGHPDSITRQTAFDFNELQDREYKYVSNTDSSGWRAGGGESGVAASAPGDADKNEFGLNVKPLGTGQPGTPNGSAPKTAAPDTTHIPIIHIDAESQEAIDNIIAALARGEIFIPHMAITPEALSVDGVSPPDLVVRFGTERNDDLPPDEWPNWCLEFMHNQLYEYFQGMGARWMKRPFSITLAKKVRWKTVKHMNRYFANAERVVDAWREKGPQYLDPQLAYVEGGATPDEVVKPHGIYLLRNGVPTNYFAPNFEPPYTTKMTRSLLLNVLDKSWDKKRREWTSDPVPRLLTPSMLVSAMCGCGDNNTGGFVANEVTLGGNAIDKSTIPIESIIRSATPTKTRPPVKSTPSKKQQAAATPTEAATPGPVPAPSSMPDTPAGTEASDTDIISEPQTPVPIEPIQTDIISVPSQSSPEKAAESPQKKEETAATPAATSTADSNAYTQLNLQVSGSSTENAKAANPAPTVRSPKYGAPPTPEEMRSTRSPAADLTNTVTERDGPESAPASETGAPQPSVTGSNSTIMHMNLSAQKFMKRELARSVGRDEKKEDPATLASDEDWLDEMGKPLPSPAVTGNQSQGVVDQEVKKQVARVALAQEKKLSNTKETGKLAQKAAARARSGGKDPLGIQKNNSGVSLDYSADSTFIGDQSTLGGNSSLLGGRFATDGSVATASTKGTWAAAAGKRDPIAASPRNQDDDDASALSLQESTSSIEVIPTDEELFAVGWAKALDPKSGSYYYFTLDRTKIVWDNPLASRGLESTDTGSFPEGAAVI